MYWAFIMERELEKLRQPRESRHEPLALELPVPTYRPEPDAEDAPSDERRGVVIIDMNDYTEVEHL